jgi:hypothetical protein
VIVNLAGQPVDAGDSWSQTLVESTGLPRTVDRTWTLKARRDGIAEVELAAKVRPNPHAKHLGPGWSVTSYQVSGEQKGSFEFREATGDLVRYKTTEDLRGTIKSGHALGLSDGHTRPISRHATMEAEWVKP